MDELEFRRRVLSDPKKRDSDILTAIRASDANSKFVDDAMDLDVKIAKAMNVEVPEGLADRILFSHNSKQSADIVRPSFTRRAMSLAASVAFAFGLFAGQVNWGNVIVPPVQASLAQTAIKHVIDEQGFIAPIDEQVGSVQINAKMLPFESKLVNQFPYHVYYLNHCGFGKANAVHMVFQGEKGKVTLFVAGIAADQSLDISEKGFNAIVEPLGSNSLILVGEKGEDMAKIAESLIPIIQPMS
ncbi:DUF3379 domain-containing protein [Vibrio sp.]|uniref:DUF3379 domain-containing protein n=1 Tax=Vibrio sp. TaxID=678 RepID=UPI003D0EF395